VWPETPVTERIDSMHTLHWVAVKSNETIGENGIDMDEAKESAASEVNDTLTGDERPYADWYDWFVVGGGRFFQNTDAYVFDTMNVIAFAEDPKGFSKTIREALESRATEMRRRLAEITRVNEQSGKSFEERVEEYITYSLSDSTEYPFDPLSTMYQFGYVSRMAAEYWLPDTYFYDITNGVTEMRYLLKDMETNEDNDQWFLVPVDFHY
jgi:hypothetical protein